MIEASVLAVRSQTILDAAGCDGSEFFCLTDKEWEDFRLFCYESPSVSNMVIHDYAARLENMGGRLEPETQARLTEMLASYPVAKIADVDMENPEQVLVIEHADHPKIRWEGYAWKACQYSPFFRSACRLPFRERSMGKIILHDDDPVALRCLFSHLTCGDYYKRPYAAESASSSGQEYNAITEGVRCITSAYVYGLADKYMIPSLKSLARQKILEFFELIWYDKFFSSIGAEGFWRTFFEAVELGTPDCDRGLRDIAKVNWWRYHRDEMQMDIEDMAVEESEWGWGKGVGLAGIKRKADAAHDGVNDQKFFREYPVVGIGAMPTV